MNEAFLIPRDYRRAAILALTALGAGLVNGFFGTGGGMVLILALSALLGRERGKEAFVISSAGVLAFSLASLSVYGRLGKLKLAALPDLALPALIGGFIGALLFGRVGTRLLRKIFAVLLVYSGLKMMGVL